MKMRHFTYKLFTFLSIILSLYACRKDMSTLDINKIQGVEIDTTGQSNLSIFQFEKLVVKPTLKTGSLPAADLSYEWKINLEPRSINYDVIGTGKDLDFEVRLKPTKPNEFHQILYTVTDNKSGLKYIMSWPLAIRNSIGEGLVISETTDGINSDISHIMSPLVTPSYSQVSIKHKVYSAINGKMIPGLVKQMRYSNLKGAGSIMLGITDNSLFTIKTLDYTAGPANYDLFFNSPDALKPQTLNGLGQVDAYVGNNQLHSVWLAISSKFGLPYASSYSVPGHLALNRNSPSNPAVVLNFYDELHGHFVYQPSISSFGDRKMYPVGSVAGEPFNPRNLPNMVNLAAGVTLAGDFMHVLKDKGTNKTGLYIINGGKTDANWNVIPPSAKSFIDLSDAPEIGQAVHYVLLDNQSVMYYATKTKIYAVMYGAGAPTFSQRYTVAGGEEITTLQIYQQSDYPLRYEGSEPYLSTNNKQLLMSTYGSEGKVYILPMINAGLGNIDVPNIKTYTGFAKVTAISTQR